MIVLVLSAIVSGEQLHCASLMLYLLLLLFIFCHIKLSGNLAFFWFPMGQAESEQMAAWCWAAFWIEPQRWSLWSLPTWDILKFCEVKNSICTTALAGFIAHPGFKCCQQEQVSLVTSRSELRLQPYLSPIHCWDQGGIFSTSRYCIAFVQKDLVQS